MNFVLMLQQFLNTNMGSGLATDGISGPRTATATSAMASLVRVVDQIQIRWGRASTYGGPEDWGDLYEGQAFFPIADPDGSGPKAAIYTPAKYYHEICPDALRGYLNPKMGELQTWPKLKNKAVGVSYFLNPDQPGEILDGRPVYYAAARLSGDLLRRARAGEAVYLEVFNPAIVENGVVRSVLFRVLDWGPTATWTAALIKAAGNPAGIKAGDPWRFAIDLAPGGYLELGLGWNKDKVWWGMYAPASEPVALEPGCAEPVTTAWNEILGELAKIAAKVEKMMDGES